MNTINHVLNIPVQSAGVIQLLMVCGRRHFEARHRPGAPEIWRQLTQDVCVTRL